MERRPGCFENKKTARHMAQQKHRMVHWCLWRWKKFTLRLSNGTRMFQVNFFSRHGRQIKAEKADSPIIVFHSLLRSHFKILHFGIASCHYGEKMLIEELIEESRICVTRAHPQEGENSLIFSISSTFPQSSRNSSSINKIQKTLVLVHWLSQQRTTVV